jgi:tRNA-specific 2-thiouridylase
MKKEKLKVFVGLSGGVDSAVAAALLARAGYEVSGVFIKVWEPPGVACTWRQERRDAMRVAAELNIPLITLDLAKEYKRGVVDELLAGYRAGRTPNPDILCNREIKFGAFYKWARERGADFVATGHYVRKNGAGGLSVAADKNKDQSYWLWTLRPEVLAHALFPIGDYAKTEVRKLAKKFGLPVAAKKDSQGLCFIGPVDFKKWLRRELGEGSHLYTIGEKVEGKFVVDKKAKTKELVTGLDLATSPHASREFLITETNWLAKINPAKTYQARARYRAPLAPLTVQILPKGKAKIVWSKEPQLAVPGQSLVIYDGQKLVGGGIIV